MMALESAAFCKGDLCLKILYAISQVVGPNMGGKNMDIEGGIVSPDKDVSARPSSLYRS